MSHYIVGCKKDQSIGKVIVLVQSFVLIIDKSERHLKFVSL